MRRVYPVLILFLLVTGAAAFFWRTDIVGYLLRFSLSASGIRSAQLQVADVSFSKVVIRNAHLAGQDVEIPRLELRYSLGGLISGHLEELVLTNARIGTGVLTDATSPLRASFGKGEGGFEIRVIRVENGRIDLIRPSGGSATVNGQVNLAAGTARATADVVAGHSKAKIALRTDGLSPGAKLELAGSGIVYPGDFDTSAETISGRVAFSVKGEVALPDPGGDARTFLPPSLDLAGRIDASDLSSPSGLGNARASFDWTLTRSGQVIQLGLPKPAQISGRFPAALLAAWGLKLGQTGEADVKGTISEGASPLVQWRADGDGGRAEIAGQLKLDGNGASAAADVDLELRHDRFGHLLGPSPLRMAIQAGPVPFQIGGVRGRILRMESHLQGHLGPGGIKLAGPSSLEAANISGPGVLAKSVSVDSMLDLDQEARTLSASIPAPGRVEIKGLTLPGRLEFDKPLGLTLAEARFSSSAGNNALVIGASFRGIDGALLAPDAQSGAFTDAFGSARLDLRGRDSLSGTLRVSGAGLGWPAEALRMSGLELTMPLGAGPPDRRVAASGVISDSRSPARFAPFRFDTEGTMTGNAISLSGTLSATNQDVRLPLEAKVDLGGPSGALKIGPGSLSFQDKAIQPGDLVGALGALEHVSGTVGISVSASKAPEEGLHTSASLTFGNFSAASGDLAVADLSGTLELADLFSLKSNGEQTLSAKSLVAGIPLAAPVVRFSLEPGKTLPSVRVRQGRAEIAGGTVSLGETNWDFAADTNTAIAHVRNLDIQTLLREWRIENISGSGTLSGTIPLSVSASGVSIRDGHLQAAGPGVIRVDWGAARARLMQSGDQVALAAKALENFKYTSMTIDISKPSGGEVSVAIGLDGANASVLSGRPFRFNIELRGKLEPILRALREGRRMGGDLFGGGIGQ